MRRDGAARLTGWPVVVATGALLAAGTAMLLLFVARHPGALPAHTVVPVFYNVPVALAFAVVSTVILLRLPGHPIGWSLGLVGVAIGFGFFTEGYAAWAGPGTTWMLWVWTVLTGPMFFGLAMALLLFPTGRPASPRWLWVAGLLWGYLAAAILVSSVAPWPREDELLVIAVQERFG